MYPVSACRYLALSVPADTLVCGIDYPVAELFSCVHVSNSDIVYMYVRCNRNFTIFYACVGNSAILHILCVAV